jgi:hypothetical protein
MSGNTPNNLNIEHITLGQILKSGEFLKKIIVLIIVTVSTVMLCLSHFASSESVEKLSCKINKQNDLLTPQYDYWFKLQQQKDYFGQQADLTNLRRIFESIKIENKDQKLNLVALDNEIERLEASLFEKQKNLSIEIAESNNDVNNAKKAVTDCDKDTK